MLVWLHWVSSVVDLQANNGVQAGTEHDADHSTVRAPYAYV